MLLASRSTAGHLSRNLRAFLARGLTAVPFSSSELDLRATAHIQRSGRSPRSTGVWGVVTVLFTANHGHGPWISRSHRTGPCCAPHRRVERANGHVK
jgi:hypothetical protein